MNAYTVHIYANLNLLWFKWKPSTSEKSKNIAILKLKFIIKSYTYWTNRWLKNCFIDDLLTGPVKAAIYQVITSQGYQRYV